jgi:hypothetical protein
MAGDQKRRDERSEAMRLVAQRIMTFPEGKFEPSPPPHLLVQLTDEDLVVAVEAVEAVVAKQQPRPSGKAQFRLLAWAVADARGATIPLDKPLAETVGKRLDRQAQKVRSDMDAVRASARDARLRLSSAAAADPAVRATLRQDMAAIESEERSKLEKLREEVYVGFHELDALLPGAEMESESEPEPAPAPEHPVLAAAMRAAEAEVRPKAPSDLPPIPPDLVRRLGPEGVQYMWDQAVSTRSYPQRSQDWHISLPYLVQNLLLELSKRPAEDPIEALQEKLANAQEIARLCRRIIRHEEYLERLGLPPLDDPEDAEV